MVTIGNYHRPVITIENSPARSPSRWDTGRKGCSDRGFGLLPLPISKTISVGLMFIVRKKVIYWEQMSSIRNFLDRSIARTLIFFLQSIIGKKLIKRICNVHFLRISWHKTSATNYFFHCSRSTEITGVPHAILSTAGRQNPSCNVL